jgi:hypothetical protein
MSIIYVSPSGSDSTGDGRSPKTAFRTMTTALTVPRSAPNSPTTFVVEPGAYDEPGAVQVPSYTTITSMPAEEFLANSPYRP